MELRSNFNLECQDERNVAKNLPGVQTIIPTGILLKILSIIGKRHDMVGERER